MSAEIVELTAGTEGDVSPQFTGTGDQSTGAQAETEELHRNAASVTESMYDVMRCHNSLRARLTGTESDVSALYLLIKISKLGPSRASDLAETIGADPSTVSRQVAALVKTGLLERRANPTDGRVSILVITDAGRRRVNQFVDGRTRAMGRILAHWSSDDRRSFVRLLGEYAKNLEIHRDELITCLHDEALHRPPASADGLVSTEHFSTETERSL